MLPLLLATGLCAAPPENLLLDGACETGRGWSLVAASLTDRADGGRCLHFETAGSATQDVLVGAPQTYSVAVDLRTVGVRATGDAGYAYAAVYQLDGQGRLVDYRDFVQLTGDHDWERHAWTFPQHPAARFLSLRCGLFQAAGLAELDNWTLVAGSEPKRLDEVAQATASGGAGLVGILDATDLPASGTPSSPETVRGILSAAGITAELVSPDQLADPLRLRPDRYALVVLPTGGSFPAAARDAWVSYLHRGGSFVSMGGYAFNDLYRQDGGRWVPEADYLARELERATSPETSLLNDGSFEAAAGAPLDGTAADAGWRRNDERATVVDEAPHEGAHCARCQEAEPGTEVAEIKFYLDLPAKAGLLRVSGWCRTSDVTGPGFAYLALYQYNADDELIKWRDFAQVRGTTPWTQYTFDLAPEPSCTRLHIKLGLYRATGTAWFDDVRLNEITGLALRPMNTSNGEPQDGLDTAPSQIGAFDASVPLKRVARVETAPDQQVVKTAVAVDGAAHGWVATGVRGYDDARWVPLLAAYDRYGRPRGAAGALMHHYHGFFAGSSWAYFGVDDRDLFADPASPAAAMLAEVVRSIVRGVYLRGLRCDQRLYHDGEPVTATVEVESREPLPAGLTVHFEAVPDGATEAAWSQDVPAGSPTVSWRLEPDRFTAPLYQLRATLRQGEAAIDAMTTGFVVDRPEVVAAAPPLVFRDNAFVLGGRPLFLFGADTYSYTYHSAHENPWTWSQDHRAARDVGLNLYENLQYNNPGHTMTDADWRAFRAMAQLTQQNGLVFMPGMLIGENVAIDDATLASEAEVCRGYAERMHDVPALLYYVNGDYQLRPDQHRDATVELWNRWLGQHYPDRDAIEAAWGRGRVETDGDQVKFPPPNNGRWDDPAQVDRSLFLVWLMQRWNAANVAAVRQDDTAHPITSEYYQQPFGGMDLRLTIDPQDVSNIGYFDEPRVDLDRLPLRLLWNDLRARGKGVSLGEYGVKTHPAWSVENGGRGYHIQRTEEEQNQLFLGVGAYTLAMGGAKVQTWCLRDSQARVFPWGMFYPNQLIPKDVAYVHRNESLLWRFLDLRDEPQPLAVCLPSRLRLGNDEGLGVRAGYRAFEALLGLHLPCRVVDDTRLDEVPPDVTAMILPSPFAMADTDCAKLVEWVRRGGKLLVTGDLSFDAHRQPTRAARLEELCGMKLVDRLAPPAQRGPAVEGDLGAWGGSAEVRPCLRLEPADARVLARAGELPVLARHTVGGGTVTFFADPLELSAEEPDLDLLRRVYARFAAESGLASSPVSPDEPWLQAFQRPTRSGRLHLLFSTQRQDGHLDAEVPTDHGALRLGLRHRWPALAHLGADGGVRLVVAHRGAQCGGTSLFAGQGLQGLLALDGRDLRDSEQMLITPFDQGEVILPARSGTFTALVGDVRDGAWVTYETISLAGATLRVGIDDDRRTCLILVVRQGLEAEATAQVAEAMREPWSVAGF